VIVFPIPDEYVVPTGDTETITTNGRHDVSGKATAVVEVPGGPLADIIAEIGGNGPAEIVTPENYYGISKVNLQV
jgi:hypothetical protein